MMLSQNALHAVGLMRIGKRKSIPAVRGAYREILFVAVSLELP